jgi:PAS domain S-box-containing protein
MAKKKIMVVEDEGVTAMNIKSDLLELGFEVPAVVANGEEAVRQTASLLPDLILMDITLDGPMSGIEAATEIRRTHAIPIVYLTAHTDAETLNRSKETEPFGYLPKPCSMNTMSATIEMALYKSEADSARRRAESEVKRVLTEQRIILDNIPVGVLFLKERHILWANQTMSRMFGYTAAEVVGKDTELYYPDRASYLEMGRKGYAALGRGEVYSDQTRMRRRDGSEFWCTLVGQAVNPECLAEGTIWIMEDVTERRRMEEALRVSEEKYRTVADFTHDWEFWIAPDDSILYCSPSCAKITGYGAAEFESNPALVRHLLHPDDQERYDRHRHEANGLKSDNELEYRIIHADGSIRWISHVCQPVFDDKGQFAGSRGSNRDITERKALEAEVMKVRNLEALGVLAGGIAHDFNNLFQGLLGNISLARMCTPDTSEAAQFLKNAEEVYEQASKLTAQLVAFSSGGLCLRGDLQPAHLIQEEITSVVNHSGVEVTFALADDLALIHADHVQLRQVLRHLVTNAMEAMPLGGRILVSAANEELSPEGAKVTTLGPGRYVRISIQDQGVGIKREDLPRIFDPYFSTKQRGAQKGMGLGLSLCETIIQKHGGAIGVESNPGMGTTFHIRIPAVVSAYDTKAASNEAGGKGTRLLIMDDDPNVLLVVSKFLRICGYRVDSTTNGNDTVKAVHEACDSGDPYAAVILDLAIPGGMGGKEVAAILGTLDPQVKAIVSSGYVDDPAMTNCLDYGFVAAIKKPYRLQEMKEMLAQLLR